MNTKESEIDIEIMVERSTNRIDKKYMEGKLTEEEYKEELRCLNVLADEAYDRLYNAERG